MPVTRVPVERRNAAPAMELRSALIASEQRTAAESPRLPARVSTEVRRAMPIENRTYVVPAEPHSTGPLADLV